MHGKQHNNPQQNSFTSLRDLNLEDSVFVTYYEIFVCRVFHVLYCCIYFITDGCLKQNQDMLVQMKIMNHLKLQFIRPPAYSTHTIWYRVLDPITGFYLAITSLYKHTTCQHQVQIYLYSRPQGSYRQLVHNGCTSRLQCYAGSATLVPLSYVCQQGGGIDRENVKNVFNNTQNNLETKSRRKRDRINANCNASSYKNNGIQRNKIKCKRFQHKTVLI